MSAVVVQCYSSSNVVERFVVAELVVVAVVVSVVVVVVALVVEPFWITFSRTQR